MMTRLYFVRHAQSDHSWSDDRTRPLTHEGVADSRRVTDFFRNMEIDSFYSSPYVRSVGTIADVAKLFGLEISLDERLMERQSGHGGNTRELMRLRWADMDFHESGGESIRMVQQRNMKAIEEILHANPGKSVVIGTHGTALSSILNYYDNSFGVDDFLRIIDWMPYIISLDFEHDKLLEIAEHFYIKKEYKREVQK
ncbi:MAG: histidine phosphatase family protein [Clostridiaceae bacterium]|nr:histidine phosphatase family protein [Clostridiaceae bacterium]